MEFVEIEHPKTGGRASVPVSSLPQHRLAGWRPVGERAKPDAKRTTEKEK